MGAHAWEQEPPKTHSVSRPFFDRGVGSSILASLSEAGGNDQHSSLSKPLPPRSRTCESRLSECVHVFLLLHALGQSCVDIPSQDFLTFVNVPTSVWSFRLVASDMNPVSGERSPASGIAPILLTRSSHLSLINHREMKPNNNNDGTGCESRLGNPDLSPYGMFVDT